MSVHTPNRFKYVDPDGSAFCVYPWPRDDREGAVISWNHENDGALITPDRVREFVTALCAAAGTSAPLMLEPFEWGGSDRTVYAFNGVTVRRDAKTITLLGARLSATTARGLARVLAEMADDADAEPDPRELARLTEFFDKEMDTSSDELARVFLRHFKVEERAT